MLSAGETDLSELLTFVYLLLAVGLFCTLFFVIVFRQAKGSTSALIAALICAFLSKPTIFEYFKVSPVGGVEARVARAVTNAEAATDALRQVAVAASIAIVRLNGNLVSNFGVPQLPPADVMDQNKEAILKSLENMGVKGSMLDTVDEADRDGVIRQYQFTLGNRVRIIVGRHHKITKEEQDALAMGTAEGYRTALKLSGESDSEVMPYIDDFEYYFRSTKQRRPAVWAKRDFWFADED